MSVASVLTTVNAPHDEQLDGETLAHCLRVMSAAKSKPGHMSCFFGEIPPDAQKEFAAFFGISEAALIRAARAFAKYSGQSYPLIA